MTTGKREGAGSASRPAGRAKRGRSRRRADLLHESLHRTLAENDHVALWHVDQDGRTLWLNAGMCRLLGVSSIDELEGRTYHEFFPEASLTRVEAESKRRAVGETTTYDVDLIDTGGSRRHVIITGSPVRDPDGGLDSRLGVFTDVTELRRTQVALIRSESKYRQFFLDDLTGNFLSTAEGRILECNPAFVRMFGFDSIEHARSTDEARMFPRPEDRDEHIRYLAAVGSINGLEIELRRLDGTPVWVVENVRGEFDEDGRLVRVRGYMYDITLRRQLEEQLRQAQKMEAVGQLAGGVAHDFNNTLTALLGYVALLEPHVDDRPESVRLLDQVRFAAEQAVGVTRQLLAFGRRQMLQPEEIDPTAIVRDVESMIARLMPETIRVEVESNPGMPFVVADRGQLQQVLVNLAVNARDAMPDGGRLRLAVDEVELSESRTTDGVVLPPGCYVRIAVDDTGIGMDADVLSHAFEPFFTTKHDVGTGLGLSTAYGFVRQSGGQLDVRSRPGHGTTFEILLPASETDVEVAGVGGEADGPDPSQDLSGTETILLVEDEDAVRSLTEEVLRMHGYEVIACADGAQALSAVEGTTGSIDLLLTDVVMPGIHGRELAERVRARRPEVRVAFMSGYTSDAIVRHGVVDGDVEFIAKPFRVTELAARVRAILDGDSRN